MGSELPKQFIPVNDEPIIIHTLRKFLKLLSKEDILITLPEDYITQWNDLALKYNLQEIKVIKGGKSRFVSIKNALDSIETRDAVIAIHDAVRPLIDIEIIESSYISAIEYGSGVTAIGLRDSIRLIENNNNHAVNRNDFVLVQTPQTFILKDILQAYNNAQHSDFTDDASVWENFGKKVHLVEGSNRNIKITFQDDLKVFEALL